MFDFIIGIEIERFLGTGSRWESDSCDFIRRDISLLVVMVRS